MLTLLLLAVSWTPEQWILLVTGVCGQAAIIIKLFINDNASKQTAEKLETKTVDAAKELATKVQTNQQDLHSQLNGQLDSRLTRLEVKMERIERLLTIDLQTMLNRINKGDVK